jgi:hypothetical protein
VSRELSGAIALGIVLIGMRFIFAPHTAATGYGVSVDPDPRWEAYLSAKAVRDICVRCVHRDPNSKSIGSTARLVHACCYNYPGRRRSDCAETRRNKGCGIRNSWSDRRNYADHQLHFAVGLNPGGAIDEFRSWHIPDMPQCLT